MIENISAPVNPITLKEYQQDAVRVISSEICEALADTNATRRCQSIILKSPTGSGKTLMISQIIHESLKDALTLVLSPGKGELHLQTFESLARFLRHDESIKVREFSLETFESHPDAGTVLVGNWESLTTRDKKTGKYSVYLTRDGERQNIFDYLAKCGEEIPVALVIDEAHYGASKDAGRIREFLDDITNAVVGAGGQPPVIFEASATPLIDGRGVRRQYTVDEQDVVDAGLMRPGGVLNDNLPHQDVLKRAEDAEASGDFATIEEYLLEAADNKRMELNELYRKADSTFNALMAVQIPNSVLGADAQRRTLDFFAKKGMTVDNGRVVIFTSSVKTADIRNISDPDSPVDVLIYKQSIATGWDCPRAQVLVGFRHIKSKVFTIQNIGRFRRSTEAKHYEGADLAALNDFYVYSNIESGFGMHAYEQGTGVDGEKGPLLKRSLVADMDKLAKVNSYGLPITSYSRINQDPVTSSLVRKVVARVLFAKDSTFKTLQFTPSSNISLFQGRYSAQDLSSPEKMEQADQGGKTVQTQSKRSDFEQEQIFSKMVAGAIARTGDFGNNARLAERLGNTIVSLFASNLWTDAEGKRISRAKVIDSFLSTSQNEDGLLKLIDAVLAAEEIQERLVVEQKDDDDSVPATQYQFNPGRVHQFPESILVEENSDRQVRSAFQNSTLFGKKGAESGDRLSWWQEKSSEPERLFQDHLQSFLGQNPDYELAVIHKNAPWLDGKNLSLGLVIRVEDQNNPKHKRIANFFPDFLLVLRNKKNGAEFPVIVEVKGDHSNRQDSQDRHIEHKVKAAYDYYQQTGIPFFVVESTATACAIMGSDEREEDHAGARLFTLLGDMLDEGASITKANIESLDWMEKLGS